MNFIGEPEQNKWDIMAKVLAGEASNSEKDVLETWKNLDEDNKTMFDMSEKDWYAVKFQTLKNRLDVDSAWEKQLNRIQKAPGKPKKDHKNRFTLSTLNIAASIIILLGLGLGSIFVVNKVNNGVVTVSAKLNSEPKTIILPDGSEVTLNDNSTISYPKRFTGNIREVHLKGEAFFDIKRNESLPFIIRTDEADVRVLGTSFNVNTTLEKETVEVFVYTGIVQLLDGKNPDNSIVIERGEIGRLEKKILQKTQNTDKNYLAWKTKELIFKDANLNDIAKTLCKVYDVKIEFEDPKIGECLYTSTNSTFVNEDLKDILNIICSTFNLDFKRDKKDIYVINGNGC